MTRVRMNSIWTPMHTQYILQEKWDVKQYWKWKEKTKIVQPVEKLKRKTVSYLRTIN